MAFTYRCQTGGSGTGTSYTTAYTNPDGGGAAASSPIATTLTILVLTIGTNSFGIIPTTPSGWRLLRYAPVNGNLTQQVVYARYGTDAGTTFTWGTSLPFTASLISIDGSSGQVEIAADLTSTVANKFNFPQATTDTTNNMLLLHATALTSDANFFNTAGTGVTGYVGGAGSPLSGQSVRTVLLQANPYYTYNTAVTVTIAAKGLTPLLTYTAPSAASVHTMTLAIAPAMNDATAATSLSPAADEIDLTAGGRFTWTFNPGTGNPEIDAPRTYVLRRRTVGTGGLGTYQYWNDDTQAFQNTSVTNSSPNAYVDFPAGAWAAGSWLWSVQSIGQRGSAVVPFSSEVSFDSVATPTVTVTPGTAGLSTLRRPTITWTTSTTTSIQKTARVLIYSLATTLVSGFTVGQATGIVYDSGTLLGTSGSHMLTSPLANSPSYKVYVVVGLSSGATGTGSALLVQDVDVSAPPVIVSCAAGVDGLVRLVLSGRENILQSLVSTSANFTGVVAGGGAGVTTLSAVASPVLHGTFSFSITSASGTQDPYIYYDGTDNTLTGGRKVSPYQVYTAVASFRSATVSRRCAVVISWFDGNNTFLFNTVGAQFATNTAGWTQATVTAQAPATAAYARMAAYVYSVPAGELHYVDCAALYPDPTGNLLSGLMDVASIASLGPTNLTLTYDSAQMIFGPGSIKAVVTAAGAGYARTISNLIPGTVVTFSGYGIQPTGSTSWVLRAYNGSGGAQLGSTTPFAATSSWTRSSITVTVPASGQVGFQVLLASGSTGTIFAGGFAVHVASSPYDFIPLETYNLLRTPTFETGVVPTSDSGSKWGTVGDQSRWPTQVAISGDHSYTGNVSLKTVWAPGANSGTSGIAYVLLGALPSTTYTLSAWVYVPSGQTPVQLFVYSNVLVSGTFTSAASTVFDKWQRLTCTFTTLAAYNGGSGISLQVSPAATTTGYSTFYLDGTQLELGAVATPYFDGSTGPGRAWKAAENIIPTAGESFEDGTTGGWLASGTGASVANSSTFALFGTKSLAVTLGTAAQTGAYRPDHTVTAGGIYSASVYVLGSTSNAASVQVRIEWYTAANAFISQVNGALYSLVTSGWTNIGVTGMAPANAAKALISVYTATAPTATTIMYMDAAQFEERPHPTQVANAADTNLSTSQRVREWSLGGFNSRSALALERSDDGDTWTRVVSDVAHTPGTTVTVIDSTAPLGVPLTYRARSTANA